MFLFIGGNTSVRADDVVGIFNIEECSVSRITTGFLAACQKSGKIVDLTYDLPKSFVVTTRATYVSNVSNDTIRKRAR